MSAEPKTVMDLENEDSEDQPDTESETPEAEPTPLSLTIQEHITTPEVTTENDEEETNTPEVSDGQSEELEETQTRCLQRERTERQPPNVSTEDVCGQRHDTLNMFQDADTEELHCDDDDASVIASFVQHADNQEE